MSAGWLPPPWIKWPFLAAIVAVHVLVFCDLLDFTLACWIMGFLVVPMLLAKGLLSR